jgi:hypothetical protein
MYRVDFSDVQDPSNSSQRSVSLSVNRRANPNSLRNPNRRRSLRGASLRGASLRGASRADQNQHQSLHQNQRQSNQSNQLLLQQNRSVSVHLQQRGRFGPQVQGVSSTLLGDSGVTASYSRESPGLPPAFRALEVACGFVSPTDSGTTQHHSGSHSGAVAEPTSMNFGTASSTTTVTSTAVTSTTTPTPTTLDAHISKTQLNPIHASSPGTSSTTVEGISESQFPPSSVSDSICSPDRPGSTILLSPEVSQHVHQLRTQSGSQNCGISSIDSRRYYPQPASPLKISAVGDSHIDSASSFGSPSFASPDTVSNIYGDSNTASDYHSCVQSAEDSYRSPQELERSNSIGRFPTNPDCIPDISNPNPSSVPSSSLPIPTPTMAQRRSYIPPSVNNISAGLGGAQSYGETADQMVPPRKFSDLSNTDVDSHYAEGYAKEYGQGIREVERIRRLSLSVRSKDSRI